VRTVKDFREAKGKRLVYLTAYDHPTARLCEAAGVDAILVGDSLGMVVLGYPSTVPVTLEEMLHHTKAARRGAPSTFLVAFVKRYLEAGRLIQEALSRYVAEVREGVFPGEEHGF
jgi:Ketopantoate hydroxymethyltransferase